MVKRQPTKEELLEKRDECLRIAEGLGRADSVFQGTKEEAVAGIAEAMAEADRLTKQIKDMP